MHGHAHYMQFSVFSCALGRSKTLYFSTLVDKSGTKLASSLIAPLGTSHYSPAETE